MQLIVLAALCCAVLAAAQTPPPVGFAIVNATGYTPVATSEASTLYVVEGDFGYDWPVWLLDLHGSRYQQGFDYGFLLGENTTNVASMLLTTLISPDKVIQDVVRDFCLWQWKNYLATYDLPVEFLEEMQGIADGGSAAGYPQTGDWVAVIATLANFPGTASDIRYVLEQELLGVTDPAERATLELGMNTLLESRFRGFGCSMAGAWGSRTVGGQMFSLRNLDWTPNTGAAQIKMITVFHPVGKIAHATFGFAGFFGALAGISAAGITTHEANLEEGKVISFEGFPWVLRLRYIMENAENLTAALSIFAATTNTVGFNFGLMSAVDAAPGARAGVVIETNANQSVVFYDNSPVEAAALIQNSTGAWVQYGFPLPEAVWRTNAPYSPIMRADYSWGQSITSSSQLRYMLIHDGIAAVQAAGALIGVPEMINITAIVAAKGEQAPAGNPYLCPPSGQGTPQGSNILSVTNAPAAGWSWVAWENGQGAAWRAAACNTYVGVDLGRFFSLGPQ